MTIPLALEFLSEIIAITIGPLLGVPLWRAIGIEVGQQLRTETVLVDRRVELLGRK